MEPRLYKITSRSVIGVLEARSGRHWRPANAGAKRRVGKPPAETRPTNAKPANARLRGWKKPASCLDADSASLQSRSQQCPSSCGNTNLHDADDPM